MSTGRYRNSIVLVVEDDEDEFFFLQDAFRETGCPADLRHASDGDEAIRYLSSAAGFTDPTQFPIPDLMLLDIKMPRSSGFDVLNWVRAHPALRRLPVVMPTSSSDPVHINQAYTLGANAFITKPGFDQYTEMVRSLADFWFRNNVPPVLAATGPELLRVAWAV